MSLVRALQSSDHHASQVSPHAANGQLAQFPERPRSSSAQIRPAQLYVFPRLRAPVEAESAGLRYDFRQPIEISESPRSSSEPCSRSVYSLPHIPCRAVCTSHCLIHITYYYIRKLCCLERVGPDWAGRIRRMRRSCPWLGESDVVRGSAWLFLRPLVAAESYS